MPRADTVEEDQMTAERGAAYRQWLAQRTVAVVGLARSGVAAARSLLPQATPKVAA